jgi:hypothetical protein
VSQLVHVPARLDKEALLEVIAYLLEQVHDDDTLEGFIDFLITETPGVWDVRARFRVGNLHGQGGYQMIGDFKEAPE